MKKEIESGFTLVELVVVIVIIGIISYVTVANYTDSQSRIQFDSMIKKMAGDINYARELAASGSQGTRVYIDDANNRYYLKYADGSYVANPMGGGDFIVQLGTGYSGDVEISGTSLSGGRLDFNKVGVPSNAGSPFTGSLEVATLNGKRRLSITGGTGYLKIEKL